MNNKMSELPEFRQGNFKIHRAIMKNKFILGRGRIVWPSALAWKASMV